MNGKTKQRDSKIMTRVREKHDENFEIFVKFF